MSRVHEEAPLLPKELDEDDEHDVDTNRRLAGGLCRAYSSSLSLLAVGAIGLGMAAILLMTPSQSVHVDVPPVNLTRKQVAAVSEMHVLIVGAGAAGMHAAYLYENSNISYQLIEAHSDFGGRIRQNTDFLATAGEDEADDNTILPIDLGPEWIHCDPQVLSDLLLPLANETTSTTTCRLQTIDYQPQHWKVFSNGQLYNRNWMKYLYNGQHKFWNATWYQYHRDYIMAHVPTAKIHYHAVVDQIECDADSSSLKNGEVQGGRVHVTTRDGRSFTGSHVLLAVPVSILQHKQITFVPPLSAERQAALKAIQFPPALKVWLKFDRRFYQDCDEILLESLFQTFVRHTSEFAFVDALYQKPSHENVLLLFAVGEKAVPLVEMSDDEIVQWALDELDAMFDGQASTAIIQGLVQNWSKEPFVLGGYAYNEYADLLPLLNAPVNKRIYFAGEYLGGEYEGTVHGAALSGRQQAQKIVLDQLGTS
jgi:monoamine oxidase